MVAAINVVLPCLNEAAALPWVLSRMPRWAQPIVADNGSEDESIAIAERFGATVVRVPRRGYGAACHAGLRLAGTELVAFMDADASLDPLQLERLRTAYRGGPQLVVGRRVPVSRAAWPPHLRLANRAVTARLRRRCGVRLHDLGPMRLAPRQDLLALPIGDRRSGYPLETVLRAAQGGWAVTEVEVDYHPRAGRSKVTGTPLGAWRAVLDMTRVMSS
jgi:glycosyltransferase involved in cell wall biosynthesis